LGIDKIGLIFILVWYRETPHESGFKRGVVWKEGLILLTFRRKRSQGVVKKGIVWKCLKEQSLVRSFTVYTDCSVVLI
jgi:hypothetical protein